MNPEEGRLDREAAQARAAESSKPTKKKKEAEKVEDGI